MSLILEALRKLEREKGTPERGFLVVGAGALPERSGRSWALLGLLALCAALAVVASWPRRTTPPPPAPAAATPIVTVTTATDLPARLPAPAARLSPAMPPPAPPPSPTRPPGERRFTLTAISQQDGHPVAMLNDRLVREGDAFDGVRVIRIGEAEVELEVGGRRVVVGF